MRAVQLLGEMGSPSITTNSAMDKPSPKGTDILVKVSAAGVNGHAIMWPETYKTATRIPGHEISGTITAFGPDYTGDLIVNQHVYALIAAARGQGQADFVLCSPDEVAAKPTKISHAEAAALPIPLLTAWEALVDYGKLRDAPGMSVFITGASGAVGSISVQLAARMGAKVTALASPQHHDMLKRLGATATVDYNMAAWDTLIRDVDIVLDTVGDDILTKAWDVLSSKGIIITVGDPAPAWASGKANPYQTETHPQVRYKYFIVSPSAQRLVQATALINDGGLQPLPVEKYKFNEATEAWEFAKQRGRRKKAVIIFEEGTM